MNTTILISYSFCIISGLYELYFFKKAKVMYSYSFGKHTSYSILSYTYVAYMLHQWFSNCVTRTPRGYFTFFKGYESGQQTFKIK
jgi:hypothetical protein